MSIAALLIAASLSAAAPAGQAPASHAPSYEQLKVLVDVLTLIQENYVDEVDQQRLLRGASAGMVATLDPFSQYLDAEGHKEIKTETEGQFGGIGIRVGMTDEWITVITPMPGTPAYRAGVLPNDRIVEIEGQTTKDMDLQGALKRLRGSPGTKVKMTVLRGPEDGKDGPWESKEFELTREIVKIESVQHFMADAGVGYLRVIEFSGRTTDDAQVSLADLKKQGMQGLVLDLRNNPGGLLSAAIDLASFFIGDDKLVVYTQGRRAESRQDFRASGKAPYADLPLVVLVNEGSASGSEVVAGALQDHKRAPILGSQTYGKASVQSVIPLSDGSGLRLTVARYYTPLGRAIHRDEKAKSGGISPDISISVSRETEAKLYTQWDMIYARGKKPKNGGKKEDLVKDVVLDRAVELLKARDVLSRLKGN